MGRQRLTIFLVKAMIPVFIIGSCRTREPSLLAIKELPDFPSGSAVEYFNEHIYVAGDDATHLYILDKSLVTVDSIQLYQSTEKRIPTGIKGDLEAITLVKNNNTPSLLLLGSGSKTPLRDTGWLINPATKEKEKISLDTFMKRLGRREISQINIEGAARVPAGLVMSNRGNKSNRVNTLIFTSDTFWKDQSNAPIRLVRVGTNTDTSFFNGISGIDYSAKTDRLYLTASTENTYGTATDGTIGKSYLWMINDLLSKRRLVAINPTKVIDLEDIDNRFKGYKIESVCILSEKKREIELLLVADNDDGRTTLFKVRVLVD